MRRITIIALILFISSSLFAVTNELSKPVALQAGYRTVTEFYVSPIVAQKQGFLIGMPFNIEGNDVLYFGASTASDSSSKLAVFGGGPGRVIADWNMLFNSPIDVSVSAESMKPVNGTVPEGAPELTFSLALSFKVSYITSDGIGASNGYIIYDGATGKSYIYDTDKNATYPSSISAATEVAPFADYLTELGAAGLIGESEGKIRFGFTESATKSLTDKTNNEPTYDWPNGEYVANVTLTFTAKESST